MENENSILRGILDNLHYAVLYVDENKRIVYMNNYAEILTGFRSKDLIGRVFDFCNEKKLCPVDGALSDGVRHSSDLSLKRRNNSRLPVLIKASPDFDEKKKIRGAIVTLIDNSSKVVLSKKVKELEKSASFDYLTRLYNRRLIEKEIYARLEELHRYNKSFGVMMIDIDYFKKVNDSYGHEVGDLVLKMVSKKLLDSLRPFDFLGRWGGEEFIILVTQVDSSQLFAIANRFRQLIEQSSVFIEGNVIKVTISVGAAIATPNENAAALIKRADKMLYQSKNSGRNRVSIEKRN